METITLSQLREAVERTGAAIRVVTRLEPAGGPGDKLFPPTYMMEKDETKYATETRRIDGRESLVVLLDSVASQANRMEEALLEAWRRKELDFPVVQVDFSKAEKLSDLEQISALQAPHRIADALLRDSMLDGKPFRHSHVGMAFTESGPNRATGMYRYCPTALLFGIWDSTGPKGGLGAKFQRCITSEIVGIDAIKGKKTASRMDPLHIEVKAGPVYQSQTDALDWTLEKSEAAKDKKGQPILVGKKGNPSAINHSNIPPSIDSTAGGVTIGHAVHTVVLSLGGLRRLRFPSSVDGSPIAESGRPQAELAARTLLAALGLAAIVYQREAGYDLRSRCVLVPKGPLEFELVPNDGTEPKRFSLDRSTVIQLVKEAQAKAGAVGLGWERGPITLTPAPKLVQLIQQSRELVQAGDADAGT